MLQRVNVEYTYYAGFEREFKKITKKYSLKDFYNNKYKNEILEYKKNENDISEEEEEEEYDLSSESESEDEFDNMDESNKKIKSSKVRKLNETNLFHYHISKRLNDDKKKYDCSVVILDNEIKLWLIDHQGLTVDKINKLEVINIDDLYTYINDFRINLRDNKYKNPKYRLFIDYLEELFSKDYNRMDKMIEAKSINFESLWYYFDKIKTYYIVEICEREVCFYYNSFYYSDSEEDQSQSLVLCGSITLCNKDGSIYLGRIDYSIPSFKNKRSFDSFKIKILNENNINEYKERSKIIIDYIKDIKQMNLIGKQYICVQRELVGINRKERVIVDNTNQKIWKLLPDNIKTYPIADFINMDDDLVLFPFIPIFNIGCGKVWGLAYYEDLKPVTYKENVFNEIVMCREKKELIMTVVKNYDSKINNNIIDGKGNNLIFLLHGPPGVGKTLTAEAISESLKKPLYHINIGDLDLDPSKLELNLKEIDELCNQWNAILLIDEADIFLEARNYSDISRNIIVAIFLKFLEYSKNIIFLTTNRLDTLDDAIRSRINLTISYSKLNENDRIEIWRNVMIDLSITNKEKLIKDLSRIEINGREISNLMDIVIVVIKSRENHDSKKISGIEFKKVFDKCMEINNESVFSNKNNLYL